MRKKFFAGAIVKGIKKVKNLRKVTPEFKEAIKKHKKLLNRYKNKPLDEDAVKQSYKIFAKPKFSKDK